MENFCLNCEKRNVLKTKKVNVPVGRKKFPLTTEVCSKCGAYSLNGEQREKIDNWARSFKSKFIEYQPRLSHKVLNELKTLEQKYSLNISTIIRNMISIYLIHLTEMPGFHEARRKIERHSIYQELISGKKMPFSLPISYNAFNEIDLYSSLTGLTPAKVIEEIVYFAVFTQICDSLEEDSNSIIKKIDLTLRQASIAA